MALFGLQHMFAMFGATILVPTLTGLSVSATLLFAGVGTLLFHLIAKGQVPAFLGSSFAFIAGVRGHRPQRRAGAFALRLPGRRLRRPALPGALGALPHLRPPARHAVLPAGGNLVPSSSPIGLILASSAIANCETNWLVALVAIAIIVVANIWGRGMIRIIPILLGVIGAYLVAALLGEVDFAPVAQAAWIGLPVLWDNTVFSLFGPGFDAGLAITAVITIMPLAFATMIEHIGDMSAISSTCGRNYIASPGLHRTLLGDGLATILASLFGAPANTTYGENTGVLALTRVFDPRVVRLGRAVRHRVLVLPQVRGRHRRHARVRHRRRVARALRHDLGGGHPQPGGEPRRLHVQPQRAHHRARAGALARHRLQRLRGHHPRGRRRVGWAVGPGRGLGGGGILLNVVLPGKDGDEAETHQVSELVEEEPEMRFPLEGTPLKEV